LTETIDFVERLQYWNTVIFVKCCKNLDRRQQRRRSCLKSGGQGEEGVWGRVSVGCLAIEAGALLMNKH